MTNRIKCLFVGNGRVGKTTLLGRLLQPDVDLSTSPYTPTIGANFIQNRRAAPQHSREDVMYQFWDIGGQEKYKDWLSMYVRNTKIFVYCVDLFEFTSANEQRWLDFFDTEGTDLSHIIVVGTKVDRLDEEKALSQKAALELFCTTHGFNSPMITSLKDKTGIDAILQSLDRIVDRDKGQLKEMTGIQAASDAFDKATAKETAVNIALRSQKDLLMEALSNLTTPSSSYRALEQFESQCAKILHSSPCRRSLMAATNRLVGAVLVTLLVAVTGFAMGFFAGLPLGPMAFVTGCAGAIAAVGVTVAAERQATQRGWPTLGLFGPSAIDSSIHQFRKGLIASQEPTRLAI